MDSMKTREENGVERSNTGIELKLNSTATSKNQTGNWNGIERMIMTMNCNAGG
jgi:hypothetical protein